MGYRLFDFSSDVGIEGDGADVSEAFVGLAQALAHVLTDGSSVRARTRRTVDVEGAADEAATAVAFVNELIYWFDSDGFLPATGSLHLDRDAQGRWRVRGQVSGEAFDPARHRAGRGAKAATFHDAQVLRQPGLVTARLVLDL